ncbi:MAG: ABC transporter ATP-binding protein [Veillonella sp.]|uniref:ABC transporter ATP-binding protein n=1 Tax=Veillonella sp. TaxID=1926307 RepID=UPI0025F3E3FA|nr:ABC transporter ATP-binding protein [Veillonella sp.]MBS4913680.1 ABC transporter ATP-binding protein [Veillonella sp.]
MSEKQTAIAVEGLDVSFVQKDVLKDINWQIPKGRITALVGPNGCGKSTLLKCIIGNLKPHKGRISINGQSLESYSARTLAHTVAFLPQSPEVPGDMTVEELVYCGRYPHQKWWINSAREDRIAVEEALGATKTLHLKDQIVQSLSGGERQRVWIAMALAQESDILLLDEPTTYLDINHQLEIMELLQRLNKEKQLTVVMVLHELNQAAEYAHEVGVIHKGGLKAVGTPAEVFTEELLRDVFAVSARIEEGEKRGAPYIKIKGLLK